MTLRKLQPCGDLLPGEEIGVSSLSDEDGDPGADPGPSPSPRAHHLFAETYVDRSRELGASLAGL